MKRLFVVIIMFLIFISNTYSLELYSENIVLYNLNDDIVIFENKKDELTSIASLTKIMTVLVAIENIDNIYEEIIIDTNMFEGLIEADAAIMYLNDGERVTYKDLLYSTLLASAADATRALTINVAGSEKEFVKLMNKRATKLGLSKTVFKNPIGLDEKGQYSTVDDVAVILKEALSNKLFKEIFECKQYSFVNGTRTIRSTTAWYDSDIIKGSKTGYTDEAGLALASTAYDEDNDIHYLLITTKAPITEKRSSHILDAISIYNYYFDNYKYYNLIDKGDSLIDLNIKNSKIKSINLKSIEDVKYFTDHSFDKSKVELKYNGKEVIKAPIKEGSKIGVIDIFYNGVKVDEVNAVIQEKIPLSYLQFIKNNILVIIIITFAIQKLMPKG